MSLTGQSEDVVRCVLVDQKNDVHAAVYALMCRHSPPSISGGSDEDGEYSMMLWH